MDNVSANVRRGNAIYNHEIMASNKTCWLNRFWTYCTFKGGSIGKALGIDKKLQGEALKYGIYNLHYKFWELTLEERAVIFNYLLIPANKTISEGRRR